MLGGPFEHALPVDLARALLDELGALKVAQGASAHRRAQVVVLAVDRVRDLLEHHAGVALAHRVHAVAHQRLEELGGVGHVEVAAQRERAGRHAVPPDERVADRLAPAAVRAVAQVADHRLAQQGHGALELERGHRGERMRPEFARGLGGLVEDALDRAALGVAQA